MGGVPALQDSQAYWSLAQVYRAAAVAHKRAALPDTQMCGNDSRVCIGILSKACPRLAPVISGGLALSSAFCSRSCLPHLKSNQICHDSRAALACSGVTGGTDWPLGCKFDFRLWTWCKSFSLIRSDYTKQLQRTKLKVTDGAGEVSACTRENIKQCVSVRENAHLQTQKIWHFVVFVSLKLRVAVLSDKTFTFSRNL